MTKASSIKPLSDFLRNSKSHIATLKKSQEAEILTVNGEAAIVVQDVEPCEKMAAIAEEARQDARLKKAMAYFRNGGKGIKVDDVFADLDAKYLQRMQEYEIAFAPTAHEDLAVILQWLKRETPENVAE
jgi:hypothetical protein